MSEREEFLKQIMDEIFKLDKPKIDEARSPQISDFIDSTINGDTINSHLTINADLEENKRGVIVYVLTNKRLIKVDIGTKEVQSASYPLDTITGIERRLMGDDRAQVLILFQNNSFGLRYSPKDKNITEFFQKVDESRGKLGEVSKGGAIL